MVKRATRLVASSCAALILVGGVLLTPGTDARAETTFVVNSTGDENDLDFPGGTFDGSSDGSCDVGGSAAGSQCTLRASIQEANIHSGPDTIAFDIPGDGVQNISLTGELPSLSDISGPTIIDGYTQPGSSPNTDPFASNARIMVQIQGKGHDKFNGLDISSPNNTVRGLAFYGLQKAIRIYGSDARDNHISGNFIGTDAAGTYGAPELIRFLASGVHLAGGASNNVIGGASAAERNVISGNDNEGVEVSHGVITVRNQVVGNFIGTDVTGTYGPSFAYNGGNGVFLEDGVRENVVSDNVIGNNNFGGVKISRRTDGPSASPKNNQIYNNRIGISLDGTAIPNGVAAANAGANNVAGVRLLDGAQLTQVGPGNIIANNPVGVLIEGPDTRFNTVAGNSIYGNTGLGIDIDPVGVVNQNDPGDGDTGANDLQNYPTITRATTSRSTGRSTVSGTLNSTRDTTFTIQLFINSVPDPSGFGEGQRLLRSLSVTTDASGNASFGIKARKLRGYISATATNDASGDTSEFSFAKKVVRKR